VEEIATNAGVAMRTFYRYFPTKEDVFAGLPRRGAHQVAALMLARPAEEPPFEALIAAMRSADRGLDRAELDRWLAALLHSNATESIANSALMVMRTTLTDAFAQRVGAAASDVWPTTAGAIVAAALSMGTVRWMMHGGDLIECEIAALEIAGRGLRNQPFA
jgi:AcrR family transcriptional regulator